LFQIRHRFGCYDQVTEVNRLRVRYCNWVRFLKITQHHSEQHVNVLGTKIKGTHTSTTGSIYIYVFISPKYVFIIIYFYSRRLRDYIRVSCWTCSGFNTVCGFMVGSRVRACMWTETKNRRGFIAVIFFYDYYFVFPKQANLCTKWSKTYPLTQNWSCITYRNDQKRYFSCLPSTT